MPLTQSAAGGAQGAAGLIHARGVARRFGAKVALAAFDLDVHPGAVTGLLGPNGSGKSTLMRCLVGLVRADAGEVTIDGVRLVGDGAGVRQQVTYAPGELHLYGELSGRATLAFLLRGRDRATRRRAEATAHDLNLPLERRVRGYSHGMKRQLVFAAALAPDVRVRILDEISEGLDPSKRSEILDRIQADAASGRAVLLSSHHLGEVDRACARLLFVAEGRLLADESAAEVARRSARRMAIEWADAAAAQRASERLAGPDVDAVAVYGARVTFSLAHDDPRPFLARLQAATDLPAPRAIEHGRMSLTDLYRDLYGVEGT
ncbi:MAG: ABC transporter ATP-binding protein [Planctomycetota bacterium]